MSMELIIKALVFKRLGDQSRVAGFHSSPLLANIISDLKTTTKSLTDIALSAGMYRIPSRRSTLTRTGSIPRTPASGARDNMMPGLIRAGVIKALEVYQSTSKPLDFFWMLSGPKQSDPWKVVVAEAADTIVVIFFTPDVPCNLKMVDDYSMWVVEQTPPNPVVTRHTKRPVV
jgi:hypothetical protein